MVCCMVDARVASTRRSMGANTFAGSRSSRDGEIITIELLTVSMVGRAEIATTNKLSAKNASGAILENVHKKM